MDTFELDSHEVFGSVCAWQRTIKLRIRKSGLMKLVMFSEAGSREETGWSDFAELISAAEDGPFYVSEDELLEMLSSVDDPRIRSAQDAWEAVSRVR